MPRTVDKQARRAELVAAAARVFDRQGVANTAVSDIVAEAGVAQGTFYLYFDAKDDILVAVAEAGVNRMLEVVEAAVGSAAPAAAQLHALLQALGSFQEEPGLEELAELIHRPENRDLHRRLEERIIPRLVPLMEGIVRQGVAEGTFHVADPRAATWFVLGGLRGAEMARTPTHRMPEALAASERLALRALGYGGPV